MINKIVVFLKKIKRGLNLQRSQRKVEVEVKVKVVINLNLKPVKSVKIK
jgi:hypothetical protein